MNKIIWTKIIISTNITILIISIVILITLGTIRFLDIGEDSQYCNHDLNWDECDGKIIKISGSYPDTVYQHPIMTIPPEIFGNNSKQYQSYLDTDIRGQIVLLSDEKIYCPDKMTIIGILETNVGPCDSESTTKKMYCGSSITVKKYECN